jgi:hypothetical protein
MTEAQADTILAALHRLGEGPPEENTTLDEIVSRLDSRAHALVLFMLAAPNLTPGPSMPGFSTLFGVPLCIVAAEMALGRRHLRLPGFLARREIRRGRVASTVVRIEPLLRRVELVLQPRGHWASGPTAERVHGAACLLHGVLLTLPIPIFSLVPAAAIVAIALGLLARDSIAVGVGHALGFAALALLVVLAVLAVAALDAG